LAFKGLPISGKMMPVEWPPLMLAGLDLFGVPCPFAGAATCQVIAMSAGPALLFRRWSRGACCHGWLTGIGGMIAVKNEKMLAAITCRRLSRACLAGGVYF